MNIGLFLGSREINHFFYFSLLQSGHKVDSFTSQEELLEHLENNTCNLLLVDYDILKDSDVFEKIRLISDKIHIVWNTMVSNFLIKEELVKYKIYGVIPKPIAYPHLLEELYNYINLIEKNPGHTLRKYPRFTLKKMHNVVKMVFPDLKTSYMGKVKDISIGGLGIVLRKNASKYVIFNGKKVQCQAEIGDLHFNFPTEIRNFNGKNRIGVEFKGMNPHDFRDVKQFILDLMIDEKK